MADRSLWKARPTWLWWSSGKDSAWALRAMQADSVWDVRGLIATVNRRNGRVAMHGVPHTLLERQAAAAGLPLQLVEFEWNGSASEYRAALSPILARALDDSVRFIAFGDLCSTPATERRVQLLARTGLEPAFPLLGRDPREHAQAMVDAGLSAWVCTVETGFLAPTFVGQRYDASFVARLPSTVDPCGENDEFHTFVEWAPGWRTSVPVNPGRVLERYGFAFAEMEPVPAARDESPQETHPDTRDPFEYYDRLRRIREHVDAHLDQHFDLASAAAVIPMTTHAFGRFFRSHVGLTFREWLTARRLDRAAAFLVDHNEPVARVSERVGFATDRTFRRLFHDRFGCSPSEFRHRERSERSKIVR